MASDGKGLVEALNQISFVPDPVNITLTFFALCLLFAPIEYFFKAQRVAQPRSESRWLNTIYWFFNPLIIRPFTNLVLFGALFFIFTLQGVKVDASLVHGFGPIGRQPLWLQCIEVLILADFIEYWVHRTFHRSRFWRVHAIHHSPEEMNWLASARMHPLNDLATRICQVVPLSAVGFSIQSAAIVIPYLFFYVIFLHSNVRWDFGPFKYVLVSPAYHHWHHASDDIALDKNFAGIFPIWDIIFGTAYYSKEQPTKYGVIREAPPESLIGQLKYPFASGEARESAIATESAPRELA